MAISLFHLDVCDLEPPHSSKHKLKLLEELVPACPLNPKESEALRKLIWYQYQDWKKEEKDWKLEHEIRSFHRHFGIRCKSPAFDLIPPNQSFL
jgi:hypothetical protein